MPYQNLTTHQLAKLLQEMEDIPVATTLGVGSRFFSRVQVIDSSLIKVQSLENGDDQPKYIKTDKWVYIGGNGFFSVEQYYPIWLSVFNDGDIDEEIARKEFDEWIAGLEGEIGNINTQSEHSITVAAKEVVSKLNSYEFE